ncbi:ABC exporter, ATPase component [Methanobrevibacter arboriphilus JCM 13429 = DSM 1125]|uniref:ABC exporter, ATPase component n=1 Tax=Methanobrevibacter arboriphilus JCM 13429 = DSM 1125 TaxID=1300164 RepID=A0A1V6N488_METAZ|nr:ABC transporter ATP-binding protein [Methanobrevibacter arboriphilus]OQD59393.1 ABC exporter, ATPase component [Methanobrevibacter arboriphilus JCM 13429 = DSM 1125]
MSDKVITVNDVSVRFNLKKQGKISLKNYFKNLKNRELMFQEFWALQNITFDVNKGDRLAILGLNGAGKSTLLKVIAGVMKPSKGSVETKGRVVPLLELSSGFDKRYTGRENIFLRGATLGFSTKYMEERFDEIVDFAEIRKFLNVPVSNYSSGMRARLGFSISTMVNPDILILDEVLSVGDAKFRKKSFKKMMGMIENKDTTVLFVSHSIKQVEKLCNKAILLENGNLKMSGDVKEVVKVYKEKY